MRQVFVLTNGPPRWREVLRAVERLLSCFSLVLGIAAAAGGVEVKKDEPTEVSTVLGKNAGMTPDRL